MILDNSLLVLLIVVLPFIAVAIIPALRRFGDKAIAGFAVLAAFVLAPASQPSPATSAPASEQVPPAPEQGASDPEQEVSPQPAAVGGGDIEGERGEDAGIPIVPIGIGVGSALVLGAGAAWWLRGRRSG